MFNSNKLILLATLYIQVLKLGQEVEFEGNKLLKLKEDVMMTYGDGLSNVNINELIKFHYNNKAEVTLTAVKPKIRYGI